MGLTDFLNRPSDTLPRPTITISCEGATTVDLSSLNDLQGDLKTLSDTNYEKLRRSIEDFGFSFPVFMWTDSAGKRWIVDAHQRVKTLKRMQDDGYVIPPLPADNIFARDKTEAKKKLLVLNNQYGRMTDEGLSDFMNEVDARIDIGEMENYLDFPDITLTPDGAIDAEGDEKPVRDPSYQIVIACQSADDQQTTFDRLQSLGISCKAVTS